MYRAALRLKETVLKEPRRYDSLPNGIKRIGVSPNGRHLAHPTSFAVKEPTLIDPRIGRCWKDCACGAGRVNTFDVPVTRRNDDGIVTWMGRIDRRPA